MKNKYIDLFNEAFKCNVSKKMRIDMPFLNGIYERFENDMYIPSEYQKVLTKQRTKKYAEIMNMLDKKQREAFDTYFEIENEMQIDIEKQLFIFGFLVAKVLDTECERARKRYK